VCPVGSYFTDSHLGFIIILGQYLHMNSVRWKQFKTKHSVVWRKG